MKDITIIEKAIKSLNSRLKIQSPEELIFSKDYIKDEKLFLKEYNKKIKACVSEKVGVYFWLDQDGKIIYIGVAGKLNRNGDSNHILKDRLIASRGKNITFPNKDVTTNKFIFYLLQGKYIIKSKHSVEIPKSGYQQISVHFIVSEDILPASYLEANLLCNYYLRRQTLPILNNSF